MPSLSKESPLAPTYSSAPAEIALNIFSVGESRHSLTANSLIFENLIIDPGSAHTFPLLQTRLSPLILKRRIFTQPDLFLFLTHAHADHIGAVTPLKAWLEAMGKTVTVFGPKGLKEVVGANHSRTLAQHLYPAGSHLPFRVDYELEDGCQIGFPHALIEAYAVPGHTDHDMAYRLTTPHASILYLGDAIEGGLDPAYGSCLPAQVDARARLAETQADAYIGSHGWPHVPLTLAALHRLTAGLVETPSDLYPGFGSVLSPSHP